MSYLGRTKEKKKRKHYIHKTLLMVLRNILIIFRIDIATKEI